MAELVPDAIEEPMLTLDWSSPIVLPMTVDAVMSDNSRQPVPVLWSVSGEELTAQYGGREGRFTVDGLAGNMPVRCTVELVKFNYLLNPDFETGDLTGWTLEDLAGADGSLLLSEGGELYLDTSGRSFDTPDDNYRVFYEIFTGSFSDSDGDGVGDLRGIINRMDYLNDGDPASGLSLGVEGLWLTPIFESPTYHKYDVTDYYRVDDQFGTLEDLRELIELCHARGVKLILDLPINHSGDQNEWFEKFRLAHITGNDENPYYDFYSFVQSADGKGVPAGYKQIGSTKDYYECNFSEHMPEFNFDSEAVRQEMLNGPARCRDNSS